MNCPFCAEQISDNAIVCRYCYRDLGLFRNLSKRITELERELERVQSGIDLKEYRVEDGRKPAIAAELFSLPPAPLSNIILILISLVVLNNIPFLFIYGPLQYNNTGVFLSSIATVEVLFGLWLGFRYTIKIGTAFTIAFLAILFMAALFFLLEFLSLNSNNYKIEHIDFGFISYFPISALFLTSGVLIGRWFARLKSKEIPQDLPSRLAIKLATLNSSSKTPSQRAIAIIGAFISAIAPLLTFAVSIVIAYLSYLGATIQELVP